MQIQQDEATRIRNESANRTALAAIGRKRQFLDDSGGGGASSSAGSYENGNNSAMTSSLFAPLVSYGWVWLSVWVGVVFVVMMNCVGVVICVNIFLQASTRAPKRHVTSRDLIFYMEQERELRKSLTLYKSLMK